MYLGNSDRWSIYATTKRWKEESIIDVAEKKIAAMTGVLQVFASWYAEIGPDGRAVSILFGRDVDVWQGSYPDVQTFNGKCVTYREETPHSDVEAASNSHLACPSFYRSVIKYGEIHGLSLRRPPRGSLATGLPDLRLVRFSVLGNFLHLVITCLRRNKRSRKMLLSSGSYARIEDPPFSGSLIVSDILKKNRTLYYLP